LRWPRTSAASTLVGVAAATVVESNVVRAVGGQAVPAVVAFLAGYDVANDGVGYGELSPDAPDRDALIETLDEVSEQIAAGDIDIPRK
jgi:hypothetical protein